MVCLFGLVIAMIVLSDATRKIPMNSYALLAHSKAIARKRRLKEKNAGAPGDQIPVTVRIYWMRHGMSCANIIKKFSILGRVTQHSYGDPSLTDCAIRHAQQLGARIEADIERRHEEWFQAGHPLPVFSSVLVRAMETALYNFQDAAVYPIPYIAEIGWQRDNSPKQWAPVSFGDLDVNPVHDEPLERGVVSLEGYNLGEDTKEARPLLQSTAKRNDSSVLPRSVSKTPTNAGVQRFQVDKLNRDPNTEETIARIRFLPNVNEHDDPDRVNRKEDYSAFLKEFPKMLVEVLPEEAITEGAIIPVVVVSHSKFMKDRVRCHKYMPKNNEVWIKDYRTSLIPRSAMSEEDQEKQCKDRVAPPLVPVSKRCEEDPFVHASFPEYKGGEKPEVDGRLQQIGRWIKSKAPCEEDILRCSVTNPSMPAVRLEGTCCPEVSDDKFFARWQAQLSEAKVAGIEVQDKESKNMESQDKVVGSQADVIEVPAVLDK